MVQIILQLGTEVHLTSFESRLDLPISELFQGMSLARDEVRGDMQTIMNTLQRMERQIFQRERPPAVQLQPPDSSITTQVRPV
jgi:hypothetical protein